MLAKSRSTAVQRRNTHHTHTLDHYATPGSGDCPAGPTGSPRPSRRVPRRAQRRHPHRPSDVLLRLLSLSHPHPTARPNRHRSAPNPAPPHLSNSGTQAALLDQLAGAVRSILPHRCFDQILDRSVIDYFSCVAPSLDQRSPSVVFGCALRVVSVFPPRSCRVSVGGFFFLFAAMDRAFRCLVFVAVDVR